MAVETTDIAQAIWNNNKRLDKGADLLADHAKKYAEEESKYRKALSIEIMKLRDAKIPVSLIADVARGNLSKELFDRNLAEFEYKACRDKLNSIQVETNALQSLLRVFSNIGE